MSDNSNEQNTESNETETLQIEAEEVVAEVEDKRTSLNKFGMRFNEAPWYPDERINLYLGGAGGIGSWLALLLARVRCNMAIFDFDEIEYHNIGGQLFPHEHINKTKVSSVRDTINRYVADDEFEIVVSDLGKLTEESKIPPYKFMLSGFDNMLARKTYFNLWKKGVNELTDDKEKSTWIFIDGRMQMENFQIFTLVGNRPEDIKDYEENFLFDDSEVEELRCNAKSTSHFGAMIASMIVNIFTNHITNVFKGDDLRDVPYFTSYDGDLCLYSNNVDAIRD